MTRVDNMKLNMQKQTIAEKQAKIKELEAEILAELPEVGEVIQNLVVDFFTEIEHKFNVSISVDQLLFYHDDKAYENSDHFLLFEYQS